MQAKISRDHTAFDKLTFMNCPWLIY